LSAQRIYQDLVIEQAFAGSYHSVQRFVQDLRAAVPLPFRRMEVEPGQEVQVDFGQGAWVIEEGRRRRPHLFRMVLSHARKGYSEAVWRQTTEIFIRCLENAFRHFGGVTRTTVIDNLRAAVSRADWFEPELNPKVEEFCRHYGTVILPCKPAMPRHKGKVEAGVKYVQNNALAGRTFESLTAQNLFLAHWERTVADTRIHGTIRQQVLKVFNEVERPKLLPLPASLFPVFEEAPRTVHRDGYIEVQKAYYSVPPEGRHS
jgi:transposase